MFRCFAAAFALPCGAIAAELPKTRTEISHAAQPQLAVGSNGRVWLAYGQAKDIYVARYDDGGKTFAPR